MGAAPCQATGRGLTLPVTFTTTRAISSRCISVSCVSLRAYQEFVREQKQRLRLYEMPGFSVGNWDALQAGANPKIVCSKLYLRRGLMDMPVASYRGIAPAFLARKVLALALAGLIILPNPAHAAA